jgi:hypothetical protein
VSRRLATIVVALLALLAVAPAWASPWVCRAPIEARACHCEHGSAVPNDDACCAGAQSPDRAMGPTLLLAPAFPPARPLASSMAIPAAVRVERVVRPAPGFAHDAPARAPPVPLWLEVRTLLV